MCIHLTLLARHPFRDKRFRWGYVLILTVLTFQHRFTVSEILRKPMNTVSVIGNKAKMECSRNQSTLPIDWEFAPVNSTTFLSIYISNRITENQSSRYRIDTDNNTRYDVVIDSVHMSHAGTYRCTPITKDVLNPPSDSAQLIALASDPVCNTNASADVDRVVEGDYIRMWCTVNYSGNWIPVMEWTRSNGEIIDADVLNTNTLTTVTSSLITQLNSSDNGVTFACKTSFKPMTTISRSTKTGEAFATNVPHYQHLWNFKAIVLYTRPNAKDYEQYIMIAMIVVGTICCLVLILCLFNSRLPCRKGTSRPEPDILHAVQLSCNGGHLQQQSSFPVDSEVRGEINRSVADSPDRRLVQPMIPVYSLVKRETRGPKNSEESRQTVEAAAIEYHSPKKTVTGADGTQYLDVTSIRGPTSRAPLSPPPMFSVVETYASIDHTFDDPPPLPPKRH